MLFLLFMITLQLWPENIKAQKFRMDYMWAQSFETFYRVHDLATEWAQARQVCEAEGAALLVPDSLDEMENLKLLMSNMKAHYTAIFIGLHDQFSHGDFVTVKGHPIWNSHLCKQSVLSLIWAPGSPDNADGNEHCVVMTREGLLDDRPCSNTYPFICKIYGKDVKYNKECDNFDMGYSKHKNGKCYKFHDEPLSWHDAYLICKVEESQLVVIDSEEESRAVTDFFSKHRGNRTPNPDILFIGFSDLLFPFEYRTVKGKPLQVAGRNTRLRPVTENLSQMALKRCGAINRAGQLTMTFCDEPAMFICEAITNYSAIEPTK